jgi:hypothetical protein
MARHATLAAGILLGTALMAGLIPAAFARHSPGGDPEPTLEIFSNQQPILIGRSQPKGLTLLGAVYDGQILFGRVTVRPNGPQETACPIFFTGGTPTFSAPRNSTNVPVPLTVSVPANHPLGNFNCGLTYTASQTNPATGEEVPIRTNGNQVNVPYTVKNRFVP